MATAIPGKFEGWLPVKCDTIRQLARVFGTIAMVGNLTESGDVDCVGCISPWSCRAVPND
jgi:hypothetical protein